jgi:hypothetical protein
MSQEESVLKEKKNRIHLYDILDHFWPYLRRCEILGVYFETSSSSSKSIINKWVLHNCLHNFSLHILGTYGHEFGLF